MLLLLIIIIIWLLCKIGRFAVDNNCTCFYSCDKAKDSDELVPTLNKCADNSQYSAKLNRCSYSCKNTPTQV